MIRKCRDSDLAVIYSIINDAAQAYKGVIPQDCWKEPYMAEEELIEAIVTGITFWGYEEVDELAGVMGIQPVQDVTLIRHAYVRPDVQNRGIGGKLLAAICRLTARPLLVGTWRDATWAIRFYEKHGFRLVSFEDKESLLRRYWSIPNRQIVASVVLADRRWHNRNSGVFVKE